MPNQDERDAILTQFTCDHIRLTRAPAGGGELPDRFHWAPGCVHPKMHRAFDGQPGFCARCPCYTARRAPPR